MRLLAFVLAAAAGCGSSTLSGPCSLDSACSDGEVCDFTAEGGPICISADGDVDNDGIPNGEDFCEHAMGGRYDEDKDGVGDDCDKCPIAPPRDTPDSDGDGVESPCDPAPTEPGDEIIFFDGFNGALSADWKAMTPAAWTGGDGEVTANLSAVATEDSLSRVVPGKTNVAVEIGYKVDRVENSSPRHMVAVYADDPRPAGTATVQCGVSRADSAAGDLVFVQTNSGQMSSMTVDPALLTTKSYRASAYMSGARAGCVVIANNMALGTVQTTITPDDLSTIALNAQSVTARFQYVLVVGH
ncbi:MAG TPA: hypothetical protein VFV99_15435 [Kofleriaceae bacterium]|nr:hypothetical protein [Kofleriaceae bacterium]